MMSEEKKYLVTGGAGFIGTNLVRKLLKSGSYVTVIDSFFTGRRENIENLLNNGKFELIEGDVRNRKMIQNAAKKKDIVVHYAAIPGVDQSIEDPVTTSDITIRGTLNVLQAAKKESIEKMIFASSGAVYGSEVYPLKDEEHPKNPLSPYGISKLTAENFCLIFHKLYEVPVVCLRYATSYGPYQSVIKSPRGQILRGAVIPRFVDRIMNNLPPIIEGDGLQTRRFTYVEDTIRATILAIEKEGISGEVFNVSSEEEITIKDLAFLIIRLAGKQDKIEPTYVSQRIGDIKRSNLDITKAKAILGFHPKVKLEEGIKKYIEWLNTDTLRTYGNVQ